MRTLGHNRTGVCICTMREDEDGHEAVDVNPECPMTGHSDIVVSVAFSADGNWIVSGSEDTLVKIWTGTEVSCFIRVRW